VLKQPKLADILNKALPVPQAEAPRPVKGKLLLSSDSEDDERAEAAEEPRKKKKRERDAHNRNVAEGRRQDQEKEKAAEKAKTKKRKASPYSNNKEKVQEEQWWEKEQEKVQQEKAQQEKAKKEEAEQEKAKAKAEKEEKAKAKAAEKEEKAKAKAAEKAQQEGVTQLSIVGQKDIIADFNNITGFKRPKYLPDYKSRIVTTREGDRANPAPKELCALCGQVRRWGYGEGNDTWLVMVGAACPETSTLPPRLICHWLKQARDDIFVIDLGYKGFPVELQPLTAMKQHTEGVVISAGLIQVPDWQESA
jgi:hypothetical protein